MSITVTTDVFCDAPGCGAWTFGTVGPRTDADAARKRAQRAGWAITRRGDLCPDHAARKSFKLGARAEWSD